MTATHPQFASTSASMSASGSGMASPDSRRMRAQHQLQGIPGFSTGQTNTSAPTYTSLPTTTSTFISSSAAPTSHKSSTSALNASVTSYPQSQQTLQLQLQTPSSESQSQSQAQTATQQQALPSSSNAPLQSPQQQQQTNTDQSQSTSQSQSAAPSTSSNPPPPTSKADTNPNPNPNLNAKEQLHHQPTIDEVEAVIRQATSTRPTPDGRPPPGKDTRTQLFVGNVSFLFSFGWLLCVCAFRDITFMVVLRNSGFETSWS